MAKKEAQFSMFKKLSLTLRNLKGTANHHYGEHFYSIPKFLYYSLFNINTFIVVGFDLTSDIPDHPLDADFRVVKPKPVELEEYRKNLDLPREFYYDKIHGVRTCYLTLCGDKLAYIHWVYLKGDYNRFLRLGNNVAELNYNTTLPEFRGRGLMKKMLVYILKDLKRQEYKMVVGVVHGKNPPALKSVIRAGFKQLGTIKTFGPFNKKFKIA